MTKRAVEATREAGVRKGGEWQGGPGARRRAPLAFLVVLATAGAVALVTPGQGSSPPTHGVTARRAATSPPTARLLLAGDVMLGRGVSQAAAADPGGLFEGVRFELASADYALANLESPLTRRSHDPAHGPNALEASPQSARLLASAGFDAMSVANNHAGDAGPATVSDTIRALARAG
ncbi:MAG: CapA family protein, partial [Gaiellaceae bacterium]